MDDTDSDEIINQLLGMPVELSAATQPPTIAFNAAVMPVSEEFICKKEHLVALAIEGQTQQYLGKDLSTDQIKTNSQEEINRLYCR